MKMSIAYDAPFLAREVTPQLTQGMLDATDFWWTLESKFPLAKQFVDAFNKKYGYNPQWSAETAYMQIAHWARMVSEAGTFYPPAVIRQVREGRTLQLTGGRSVVRPGGPPACAPGVTSCAAKRRRK